MQDTNKDLEARLRITESTLLLTGARLDDTVKRLGAVERAVAVNTRWRQRQGDAARAAAQGLTRREKWLGLLVVVVAPILVDVVHHYLH